MAMDAVAFETGVEEFVAGKPTLRQARIRRLLSANELGKLAGVAASTVLDIEAGARPRLSTIRKLAKALDVAPIEIDWPGDPLAGLDSTEEE